MIEYYYMEIECKLKEKYYAIIRLSYINVPYACVHGAHIEIEHLIDARASTDIGRIHCVARCFGVD